MTVAGSFDSSTFEDLFMALSPPELKVVYATDGLGYEHMKGAGSPLMIGLKAHQLVAKKLGFWRRITYERRGTGFEVTTAEKLDTALRAVAAGPTLSDEDFVAGVCPFLPLMPAGWPADRPAIVELRDETPRSQLVGKYTAVLRELAGHDVASERALPGSKYEIRLALILESVGATADRRDELANAYVALCNFVQNPSGQRTESEILECQRRSLEWLGHADVSESAVAAPIGSRPNTAATSSENWWLWFCVVGLVQVVVVLIRIQSIFQARLSTALSLLLSSVLVLASAAGLGGIGWYYLGEKRARGRSDRLRTARIVGLATTAGIPALAVILVWILVPRAR